MPTWPSVQHLYLSPLPLTGATAEAMADWITEGIRKDRDSELVPDFPRQSPRANGAGGRGV